VDSITKLRIVLDESASSNTEVPYDDTSWAEVFHDTSWAEVLHDTSRIKAYHDTSWAEKYNRKFLNNNEDHSDRNYKEFPNRT
jgi:hypothetical protein